MSDRFNNVPFDSIAEEAKVVINKLLLFNGENPNDYMFVPHFVRMQVSYITGSYQSGQNVVAFMLVDRKTGEMKLYNALKVLEEIEKKKPKTVKAPVVNFWDYKNSTKQEEETKE